MSQSSNIRPAPQDEELVKAKAIDVPGIEASAPSFFGVDTETLLCAK